MRDAVFFKAVILEDVDNRGTCSQGINKHVRSSAQSESPALMFFDEIIDFWENNYPIGKSTQRHSVVRHSAYDGT